MLARLSHQDGFLVTWEAFTPQRVGHFVGAIFAGLFRHEGLRHKKAAEVAEIVKKIIDLDGRAVHEMTERDWLKDLRCTCESNDK